ncbi:MAG: hypothetical protein O7G85_11340 [Planctomycetota bacterium]|nr:hypothetical protein [Planctomycetota bacterium]
MIDGVTNSDAIPALEKLMQFAGRRHTLIVNNIANLSTPGFRPTDLDVESFQAMLGEGIDERRKANGAGGGDLNLKSTRELDFSNNRLEVTPQALGENILFHDGNDRNLERIMQDLIENASTFRMAADFFRSRMDLINTAIRERI